jgi:hypothetical protein
MNDDSDQNSKTPANNSEPTPEAGYREAIVRHILWNHPASLTREEVLSALDWRKGLIQEVLTVYPQLSEAEALELLLVFGS